jgi:hypothetical protein
MRFRARYSASWPPWQKQRKSAAKEFAVASPATQCNTRERYRNSF